MDVPTDVLQTTLVESMSYRRMFLTEPWGVEFQPGVRFPTFFFAARGGCRVDAPPGPAQKLDEGDFLLITRNEGYVLSNGDGATAITFRELLDRCSDAEGTCRYGGGGELTLLVGGKLVLAEQGYNPFISALPQTILVKGHGSLAGWMQSSLDLLKEEATLSEPGYQTMAVRLGEVLFIQAIRTVLRQNGDGPAGWLTALTDPRIGKALAAMHRDPARPWTVQDLAAEAAMSRSAFAARFAYLVKKTPLAYLAEWRMQKAVSLLRQGGATVEEIGARMGYESGPSFSRAFKRLVGVSPDRYRRSQKSAVMRVSAIDKPAGSPVELGFG